jgi:hypothetical protein
MLQARSAAGCHLGALTGSSGMMVKKRQFGRINDLPKPSKLVYWHPKGLPLP